MSCLIGIDVGTTNCKAAAYSENGTLKAMAKRQTITHYLENNQAEFDPDQIWEAVQGALKEVAQKLNGEKIDGIAIASMGAAGVLLTEDDEWINRSIAWFDTRTEDISKWWQATIGRERVYEITGFSPNPIAGITKVQWIRDHKPEEFKKVKHWVSMQDYIAYRLSGEAVVDFSVACRTMAVDLKNRCWSSEVLNHAGISEDICSKLGHSGELIGKVTKKASELTGISEGTNVYVGGMDYVCGAFACGLEKSGQVLNSIGTSEQILMVTDEPVNKIEHIDLNFTCVNYVVNDKYYIQGQLISSAVIMDWFHNEISGEEVATLIDEAEKSPIGAKGALMLPYFRGKYAPGADPRAKGAFVGLTTSHTRGDLARAILEGLCYESAVIIEGIEKVTGNKVEKINVVGGAAKSSFWMQLKADILGIPVHCIDVPEAVTLGAAMLAGIGAGIYNDSSDAVKKTRREERVYTPDKDRHEHYKYIYENVYKNIFPALREMNYKIDDMMKLGGVV